MYKLFLLVFFLFGFREIPAQEIEFMALGDSGWIEHKGKHGDKTAADVHPGLEGIYKLKAAHINMINMEASLTNNCVAYMAKPFTFSVGENTVSSFASWGFNLFALANNHSADCINPAVNKSAPLVIKNVKSKITKAAFHGVASSKAELLKPATIKLDGVTVAMISIKAWNDPKRKFLGNLSNHQELFDTIKQTKADIRILSIHGGVERSRIPHPEIVRLSRKFIAQANGDLVIGHHPHVSSGVEAFRKSNGRTGYIAFSIGNGLHNGINGLNGDGLVLKANLSRSQGVKDIHLYPLRSNAYRLNPIPEDRLEYYIGEIASSSKLVSPDHSWKKSIQKKKLEFAKTQVPSPGIIIKTFD